MTNIKLFTAIVLLAFSFNSTLVFADGLTEHSREDAHKASYVAYVSSTITATWTGLKTLLLFAAGAFCHQQSKTAMDPSFSRELRNIFWVIATASLIPLTSSIIAAQQAYLAYEKTDN